MGICSSCESSHVSTAKLILQDGRLEEYSYPVKVSYVLQKIDTSSFICNSDKMEFDDVVSELNEDELLQPGQLYFALPLNRLKQPLQGEEMAALAVKASSALMKKSGDKCGCRRESLSPLLHPGPGDVSVNPSNMACGTVGGRGRRRRSRQIKAPLSAIPE